MKAIKDKEKAIAISIRLLILIITVLVFHGLRYILFFACIILLFIDLLRPISSRKYKLTLIALDCTMVLWILSMYWLYLPIENLRFQVLSEKYESAVEEVLPAPEKSEDTSWATYKLKTIFPLSEKNEIVYIKHGDGIAVYFSTFTSFFTSAGFIYFSNDTSRDFLEHPSKYDDGLSEEQAYDYIADYNQNWSFIKIY